jgi:protocatechuate 3,4-dioxygenase, beta subunit
MAAADLASTLSLIQFPPLDEAVQMDRKIDRYPLSLTRNPNEPLIQRPLTRTERTGPWDMARLVELSSTPGEATLAQTAPGGAYAMGQLMWVEGRVLDEDGRAIPNATMEIWQANSAGRYVHEMDNNTAAPVDPHFHGTGRLRTGPQGEFRIETIKPGAYPVLPSGWWWRPPHIHFSLFGLSTRQRYVTQIFFPGEPLNETDLLLNGVRDEEARQRLIFEPLTPHMAKPGEPSLMGYKLDFVLRGKRPTPQVVDLGGGH